MHILLKKYLELVKRLMPDPSQGNSIGIDIGAGDCKLVEIAKEEDTYELLNFAIEPIENNNIQAAVQKILNTLETPAKNIHTSVFGKGTLIRYIPMPRMPLEDLKQAFEIEADKYFPFPADQIYTDCYILDPEGKNKQMSVMVAAAKRELVDQRIKLLTDLGLQTDFIGLNPIALVNTFYVLGLRKGDTSLGADIGKTTAVAILDMGESVSNLTVTINKLPYFTRDVFVGGREFTKRISNALGVSLDEAEKLKFTPGNKSAEILSACESSIMNIVQELRLSFDYFTTEKNCEISRLLLTGGGSMLSGIDHALEKSLDIKASKWNVVESLKFSEKVSIEELNKQSFRLGVALGLALYNYA